MTKSAFLSVPAYALVAVSLLSFTGCGSGDGDGFSDDGDGFSHKVVSIDLVNPPCAEPGAISGYIEGNGFGAENVTITVGGIEAEVLAATGHDASFVVPEGIQPGPIEVIVTNPGGRIATINWVTCDLACAPTGPEVCDGIDNDCNDLIDDGIDDIETGTDVGECEFETESCVGGIFTVVQPGVVPSEEICDGFDNDCDSIVDDGIDDIESGSDVGECEFETESCVGGIFTVVQPGVVPSEEICDGFDNDCDSIVDDGIDDIESGSDVGECEFETESCVGGIFTVVQPGVVPSEEICDGFDNDCNGAADDGIDDIETGTDVGECEPQIETCVGGSFVIFQLAVGPSLESCDSLDNDCNGIVDDAPVCEPTCVPTGVEVCDGIDNDCNDLIDDGVADLVTGTDVGECQVEIQSCMGGDYAVTQAGVGPSAELCDLLDNDCNTVVDDDPACVPLAVASIDPVCAQPGENAIVYGSGFQPGQLEVTVGGTPAQIAASTNNSVTFVVPAASATGPTEVAVRNGGGGGGGVLGWAISEPDGCAELQGAPDELAIDAIANVFSGPTVKQEEVEADSNGVLVARTSLGLWFRDDSAVGDIRDLLESIQARITSSLAGIPMLNIRMTDPGSLAALESIVADLEANPAVVLVHRGYFPEGDALPGNVDLESFDDETNRQQIAVRAHAAWNALSARQSEPRIAMLDSFGFGVPLPGYFDVGTADYEPNDFNRGDAICDLRPNPDACRAHGYVVLSPLLAQWGGSDPLTGLAGGAAVLRVANFDAYAENEHVAVLMERLLSFGGHKAVVNLSLGNLCDTAECIDARAWGWTKVIRGFNLENSALLVSSAGNIKPGISLGNSAILNSGYNKAALVGVQAIPGTPIGALGMLQNGLVVENRSNAEIPGGGYDPGPRDGRSKVDGHVAGIGEQIWGMAGPAGPTEYLNAAPWAGGGTSYATGQVSGLAAYLWSLDPDLGVAALKSIIIGTAESLNDGDAPVIDAYAATLALDTALTPSSAQIRMAILSVAPRLSADDVFDEDDVLVFLQELSDRSETGQLDYSRYDLNGDSYTGGASTDRMDLDADGSYGPAITQLIEQGSMDFDESALADFEVLCFYAYSGLYDLSSDPDGCERSELLRGVCHCESRREECPEPATNHDFSSGICSARIVFQTSRDGNNEIYVMDDDGSNQLNLTENPASDTTPSWLPDGTRIGFSSDRDGERDIYVMDAVPGATQGNLTDTNLSEESWPVWSRVPSPVGQEIAFDLENGLGRNIYVMNADGSNRTNLSDDPASDTISSWSPDGTKILFTATRDGNFEIYLMNADRSRFADGSREKNLTNHPGSDNAPAWSPDGTKIAFWSDRDGDREIYVMDFVTDPDGSNPRGSNLENLTTDPDRDTMPTWSPDGTKIAFRSNRDGNYEIHVMNADGSEFPDGSREKNLTNHPGSDTNPSWFP